MLLVLPRRVYHGVLHGSWITVLTIMLLVPARTAPNWLVHLVVWLFFVWVFTILATRPEPWEEERGGWRGGPPGDAHP